MIFLSLISDWLSKAGDAVEGTIMKAIRTLFFSLDTLIYRLIIDLYDMFESLCSARLLTDTTLKNISDRIGLILGIIMLFYVVLGFIQMLIDPDKINDKEKGAVSIVKKVIIVIVMLGVSNFVFNTLYDIQSIVVQSHVISRLLLPYSIEVKVGDNENDKTKNTKSIMDNKKFGAILSEELFHTFYHLEDLDKDSKMTNSDTVAYTDCEKAVNAFRLQIVNYKRFEIGYRCLNESIKVQYKIEEKDANTTYSEAEEINVVYFNWLFSVICGVAVAYLMVMYCFKVGVRMIQLMFLEVISPMAFVSYLSPKKDSMFNKWTKLYISTYIDVFIRIAIINFVFFIIATLFSNNGSLAGLDFWTNMNIPDTTSYTKGFYIVIIILALLTFAHKAPDLLKDLFGTSDSKLGFGASMKDIVGLKKGIGTVAGAATGAAVGFLGGKGIGAISGVLRGAHAGFGAKGVRASFGAARKAQAEHNMAVRNGQLPGVMDRFSTLIGDATTKEAYDNQIAKIEEKIDQEKVDSAVIRRQSATLSNANGFKKKLEERAEDKLLNGSFDATDVRSRLQEQLFKKQAAIKIAEEGVYTSEDLKAEAIAKARTEYNEQLADAKERFIDLAARGSANGGFDDEGSNVIFENLENEIRINADGAFNGLSFNRAGGYASLDTFDKNVSSSNAVLSRKITVSDSVIKGFENEIQSIKNTQGYRDSHKIK